MSAEDVDYLVIHCTAGSRDSTVEDVRRFHVEQRGWSDIGYHFLIDQHGEVHAGRPAWVAGAQAQGFNARSLGIAWIGNHDEYPPTPEAWTAMLRLCHALRAAYKVDVEDVVGHRETYDLLNQRRLKSCPGKLVDMDRFRAELAAWTDNPGAGGVA